MVVKALVSFAGAFSMYPGQEREIDDEQIANDLINAGYVEEVQAGQKKKTEEVKAEIKKKKVKANED
ncbi:MAG: hypothetical protein HUJ77_12255 [Clostridium sp.]|uniref:hypothetical protein n=1 Tax=Clostridium sp. TaxID=1506 RepID=UPI0025C6D71A|nr:hypothetical protein [Clostridium sp.]MCF0149154.1 hypothetical protein [Clostridium sp.]